MENNQTAVEWLEEQMKDDRFLAAFEDEFKQAKEMEKQQIIDSFNTGLFHGGKLISTGDEYYNEKFKK